MKLRKKVASKALPWLYRDLDDIADDHGSLAEWWHQIGGTTDIKPDDGVWLIEEKKAFIRANRRHEFRAWRHNVIRNVLEFILGTEIHYPF